MATAAVERAIFDHDTDAQALPTRDRVMIGVIAFYIFIAIFMEGYWLLFNQVMSQRTDFLAWIWSYYWPADYTYQVAGYPIEKCFTIAVESINVLVMQPLSLVLLHAIWKRKSYRYPLQLLIATVVFNGTLIYYLVGHLSGYAVFAHKGLGPFLLFYFANLPWLAGYAWMMHDAYRHIARRFAAAH